MNIDVLGFCVLKDIIFVLVGGPDFDTIETEQRSQEIDLGRENIGRIQFLEFIDAPVLLDAHQSREEAVRQVGSHLMGLSLIAGGCVFRELIKLGCFQAQRLRYFCDFVQVCRPRHLHDLVPCARLNIVDERLPFEATPVHAELRFDVFIGLHLPWVGLIFEVVEVDSHGLSLQGAPGVREDEVKNLQELFAFSDADMPYVGSALCQAGVI